MKSLDFLGWLFQDEDPVITPFTTLLALAIIIISLVITHYVSSSKYWEKEARRLRDADEKAMELEKYKEDLRTTREHLENEMKENRVLRARLEAVQDANEKLTDVLKALGGNKHEE